MYYLLLLKFQFVSDIQSDFQWNHSASIYRANVVIVMLIYKLVGNYLACERDIVYYNDAIVCSVS